MSTGEEITEPTTVIAENSEEQSPAIDTEQRTEENEINEEQAPPEVPEIAAPEDNPSLNKGLKVLFLSSDTGGGHRASAQSLARQFEILFPGSTYDLLDLATETYLPPLNGIVSQYKHLSAHPSQWKMLYGVSNSKVGERILDNNLKVMSVVCERSIRKKIKSYEPDVVVSVHPLQTSVPILSCAKISHETGKHLPMFTVVTDLGSAHSTWFANGVEKMFVGSKQIYELAKQRGSVPDEKLVLLGLPIRHDFAVESSKLGDRTSAEGKAYQKSIRTKLELPATDRKTLLVMGGGEGVGSLSNIVDALYYEFTKQGIDAVICVVCGRNEKLKISLEERNWDDVMKAGDEKAKRKGSSRRSMLPTIPSMFVDLSGCGDDAIAPGCIEATGMTKSLRKILSAGSLLNSEVSPIFIPSISGSTIEDEKKTTDAEAAVENENSENVGTAANEVVADSSASTKKIKFRSSPLPTVMSEDNGETEGASAETPSNDSHETEGSKAALAAVSAESIAQEPGKVDVVGLGFITNMAEYMVAADVLISKAGPGTISEAAALSLPVMLTSFLPGQEEGNVGFVVDGGFGTFCEDSNPQEVARQVGEWLQDDDKMRQMSEAAKAKGAPYAARDIVQMIGDSTLKWREHNQQVAAAAPEEEPKVEAENKTSPTSSLVSGIRPMEIASKFFRRQESTQTM